MKVLSLAAIALLTLTACADNYRLSANGASASNTLAIPDQTSILVASLSATANPAVVPQNSSSQITITASAVESLVYTCVSVKSGQVVASGNVDSSLAFTLPIQEDTDCTIQGLDETSLDSDPKLITTDVKINVDCGNRIYDGGQCRDFACQSFVTLTDPNDLLKIPARSAAGVCYAYKLMSAIANSASNLTTTIDQDVISRNHDVSSNPTVTHHPYALGEFKSPFQLLGPRVVKLAGGANATDHILVDNFVLFGVYPASASLPSDLTTAYKVVGTSDSSIADASGVDTNAVSFMNQLIPITAFATGGTSSVSPIDITAQSPANVVETLDIRALDCGGSRQLSDIYLLFQ